MSASKKNQSIKDFNTLTEALRRGRRRIKPEYVPELAAWLLLQARRYERHYRRFCSIDGARSDPTIKGTVKYIESACKVIQCLIDDLCDGMDKWEWSAVTGEISTALGLDQCATPDDIGSTDQKIIVPLAHEDRSC